MGMIQCPDCGKEISDQALQCPSCGHPNKTPVEAGEKKKSRSGCLLVVLIAIGIAVLLGVIGSLSTDDEPLAPTPDKPANLSETATLRLAMKDQLREQYLDKGLDIEVRIWGKYNQKISLTYILFSNVWVHKFQKEGNVKALAKMGFDYVLMQTGSAYQNTYWEWKLNPVEYGYVYK